MTNILIAVLLTVFTATASAAEFTFEFAGVVMGSKLVDPPNEGDPMPGAPATGTLISGWYTFESTTPVGSTSPGYIAYHAAIIDAAFRIGSLQYTFDPPPNPSAYSEIIVEDNNNPGSTYNRDRYYLSMLDGGAGVYLEGSPIDEFEPMVFVLSVFDFEGGPDPDMITGTDLLLAPPDLYLASDEIGAGLDDIYVLLMQYNSPSGRGQILGHLTSLTLRGDLNDDDRIGVSDLLQLEQTLTQP